MARFATPTFTNTNEFQTVEPSSSPLPSYTTSGGLDAVESGLSEYFSDVAPTSIYYLSSYLEGHPRIATSYSIAFSSFLIAHPSVFPDAYSSVERQLDDISTFFAGSPTTTPASSTFHVTTQPFLAQPTDVFHPSFQQQHNLSGGAIAGIVIGALAGLAVILGGWFYGRKSTRKRRKQGEDSDNDSIHPQRPPPRGWSNTTGTPTTGGWQDKEPGRRGGPSDYYSPEKRHRRDFRNQQQQPLPQSRVSTVVRTEDGRHFYGTPIAEMSAKTPMSELPGSEELPLSEAATAAKDREQQPSRVETEQQPSRAETPVSEATFWQIVKNNARGHHSRTHELP